MRTWTVGRTVPILGGLVIGFCSSSSLAQERDNLLRSLEPGKSSTTLDRLSPPPKGDDGKSKDDEKDVSGVKIGDANRGFDSKKAASPAKKSKEPITLPTLTVPNTKIEGIGTGATPEDLVSGRLPGTIPLPFADQRYGFWELGTKTWAAPVYCHQPTYFEDTMLENHGHERWGCAQPLVSGVRFYTAAFKLPYFSYLDPPLKYSYSADHFRPGSASAPLVRQRGYYDAGALRFQILTTGVGIVAGQP